MSEVIQDIRDYFADRFSSPFWVSFIVTWLVINWELPITVIFEFDKFTVNFVTCYLKKIPTWYTWWLPVLLAAIYAIFSSSLKEIIEILSKLSRSIFSNIDRKGKLYKSISLIEHERQIARLERQLQKMSTDKEKIAELSIENNALEEKISTLQLQLKDKENKISKLSLENENPNKSHAMTKEKINENSITATVQKNENEKTIVEIKTTKETYFEKIKSHCNNEIIQSLNDPNSRANLLLVLDFFNNSKPYTTEEIIHKSGVSTEKLSKTISLASSANLLTPDSNKFYNLSESGKNKLSELKNDIELHNLTNAIHKINEQSKNEILKTLRRKSITLGEIKNEISFNQNIKAILNNLITEGKIHMEGSVYFYGPQISDKK